MGFLVNDGDKLTKEKAAILQQQNREKYGLTEAEIEAIKLPPRTNVAVYSIDKIVNSRAKLSTIEKINHLLNMQVALNKKLVTKAQLKKK